MKDEEADRLLDTPIPGGSQARDWFLPHDTSRGRQNVRDVVRRMVESAHSPTDSLKHERDCLAQGIKDAAVKAGICRADANLATADLLVLCDKMAQGLMRSDKATGTQRPAPAQLGLFVVRARYTMDGERHDLGEWTGLAPDAALARERCMEAHWDARLDAAGAQADFEVIRLLRYAVSEDWGHCFSSEPGSSIANTRWVIDRATGKFVVAQIQNLEEGPDSWQDLSPHDTSDLWQSLGDNFEIMDSTTILDFGVDLADEVPVWAHEIRRELVADLPVREISFTDTQIDYLASLFLHGLLNTIGPQRLREVSLANQAELNPGVCHTHDACDANMVMATAFERVMGGPVDLRSNSQARLWNEAWSLAGRKMAQFVQLVDEDLQKRNERQRG